MNQIQWVQIKKKRKGEEEGKEEKEEARARTTQSRMGRDIRRGEKVNLGRLRGGSMNMIKVIIRNS